MKTKINKTWGGRFEKKSHPLLEVFNASLPFDKKLYREDIAGSLAHAKMLTTVGLVSQKEFSQIQKGLESVLEEMESGKFVWSDALEDIHMAVETRLTQKVGPVGGKLHTARSRNDQVALDLRLYVRRVIEELSKEIVQVQKALVTLAQKEGFCPMPGYTHLQRAQSVLWAHHLLAYVEMLERDKSRLADALTRTEVLPLGAGALAGTTHPIDRNFVAKELHFKKVSHNSLDSVSDRDFVVEFLFCCALLSTHLSRFAEELILWVSQEFSFVKLPEEFCTGSSMMPQKVNPDAAELVRGKTGRIYGNLVSLLTTLKGLPLAYNKDLQEDKEPLFDTTEQMLAMLCVLSAMIPGIKPNKDKMLQATEEGFLLATDVADYLATKGLPFRQAHEVAGMLIKYCLKYGKVLEKLKLTELKKHSLLFKKDVFSWLSTEASIDRRLSFGGTATKNVKQEIKRWQKML